MVEPDTSAHDPNVVSGSDDIAFVEAPPKPSLRRSNTTPKKTEGLMGLLGSFRKPKRTESQDRHRSRPQREERSSRRQVETEKEDSRPSRRDDRKRRSAKVETDAEGFTTDAAPTENEDAEARRAERRAKRASRHGSDPKDREAREAREAEERRARRKEAKEARVLEEKQAREEEERRREEKRARRAAREEKRLQEEQRLKEEQEAKEAAAAERRERRRQREMEETNREAPQPTSRSRRHSHAPEKYYSQDEYAGEPRRHRSHRSGDEGGKSRRRKSSAPNPEPVPEDDGYRSPRSGRTSRKPSGANPVMMNSGKDKISSWVHSQITDPPEAPPIEPTVIDVVPPAGAAANGHSLSSDEETRRQIRRRARRQSKYGNRPEPETNPKRSRPRDSRRIDSEGSGEGERDRYGRTYDSRYPPAAPVSGGGGKRSSWFKKLTSR